MKSPTSLRSEPTVDRISSFVVPERQYRNNLVNHVEEPTVGK